MKENCLKRATLTVSKSETGLGEKEGGGVFLKGDLYPNTHYDK